LICCHHWLLDFGVGIMPDYKFGIVTYFYSSHKVIAHVNISNIYIFVIVDDFYSSHKKVNHVNKSNDTYSHSIDMITENTIVLCSYWGFR